MVERARCELPTAAGTAMSEFTGPPGAGVFVTPPQPFVPADFGFKSDYFAVQLYDPDNTDWAVGVIAPIAIDSVNAALQTRQFPDTTERGVGWLIDVPIGTTSMSVTLVHRAESGAPPVGVVTPKIYHRQIVDTAPVSAWAAIPIPSLAAFGNTNWRYNPISPAGGESYAAWGLAPNLGSTYQFELTRIFTAPNLVGDWNLLGVLVRFF